MTKIRLPYVQEYRDRTGKVRRYLRRPGFKVARLRRPHCGRYIAT
jgi:hypothetical protein